MTDYTPATYDVREAWAQQVWPPEVWKARRGEFDRWLIDHDARVAADTLRRASDEIGGFFDISRHGNSTPEVNAEAEASTWLEAEADRIIAGLRPAVPADTTGEGVKGSAKLPQNSPADTTGEQQ